MATLKETRTRIASVKKTRQVTSAMKMVSAAKLKKAQSVLSNFLPFTEKQQRILQNLAKGLDEETTTNFFSHTERENEVLLVAISSNRGLSGAFNANVIAKTKERIAHYKKQGAQVALYCIGRKVNQAMEKTENVVAYNDELQEELTYASAALIANEIMQDFTQKKYNKIELIYNHAKSASTQLVLSEGFLPITAAEDKDSGGEQHYIFEPDKKRILEELLPQMLRTQFYKTLLDSLVAEHAARMIAMNKATDNAGDLLRDLNLEYNKARQAAITNEILEIVSGAEALKQD